MTNSLSIILPIYNQANQIDQLVKIYENLTLQYPFITEVIFSINGNDKESLKACQQLKNSNFKYTFTKKGGWGVGVKNGIETSTATWVLYTNSARTHLEDLKIILKNFDFKSNTVFKGNRKQRTLLRGLSSKILNLEFSILANRIEKDINGTPKILERKLFKKLNISSEDDFFDAELVYSAGKAQSQFKNIEIYNSERLDGKSTTTLKTAVRFYFLLPLKYIQWRKKK